MAARGDIIVPASDFAIGSHARMRTRDKDTIVILGAGHAGFQLSASLRERGFRGRVVLISGERELPYQRPPLSKDFLTGERSRDSLHFRPASYFDKANIELLLGHRASRIDRNAKLVHCDGGGLVAYDYLVLATGASNRPVRVPGLDGSEITYLRTIEDADALKARTRAAKTVAIIGAGFVGLEIAASLAARGVMVELFDISPRVMSRTATTLISKYFADAHSAWGSVLRCGTGLVSARVQPHGMIILQAADGTETEADVLVAGVGVTANDHLAAACGLAVADGVVVDLTLRTSDPHVFVTGDCASFPAGAAGRQTRIESVQNAVDQARCVAATLTGEDTTYDAVPWFWSEQNGIKLQIAGLLGAPEQSVLRGNPSHGQFSVFSFAGDSLVSVESINSPGDHILARRLLAARACITPAQVADTSFDLRPLAVSPS